MKNVLILFLFTTFCTLTAQEISKPGLAPVKMVVDNYHGVELEDPYRYMEDLSNEEVIKWMKDNADYAKSVLNNIPGKQKLFDAIMELINRSSESIYALSITKDDTYYYLKRKPGEDIAKMYKRQGFSGEEVLFFDPETYNSDSEKTYTISSISPNFQGDKIAVGVSPDGSENPEIIIFKANGEKYPEVLYLPTGISWLKSGNAFYYNKYNSADVTDMNRQIFTKVYKHEVGTDQKSDSVVFSKELYPDLRIKDLEIPYVFYSEEADLDVLFLSTVDNNMDLFYKLPLTDNSEKWKTLTTREDNVVDVKASKEHVYYLSSKEAPKYKILRTSIGRPSVANAKTFIEEYDEETIKGFELTKDGLYYITMKNGVEASVYFLANDAASPRKLDLPFTAGEASLRSKNIESSEIWITISGWTSPDKRYLYNPKEDSFTLRQLSSVVEYPELDDLVAKEVMVESHDGIMVPVSIIHNKDLELNGKNPVTLYGYGSYGDSMAPTFSTVILAYTLFDGVLVVSHVRGGGELGEAWHNAGKKETKPNTWKDAIATAEYMIREGYTSPGKLSIFGGSAGGILVGRAITERPDLFSAAAPLVGSMNAVRSEESPNGPVNTPEFGTSKNPEEFKWLLEMDAYHSIQKGVNYPAMLITSGINDPRVTAWEPAKFAAKLQAATASDKPVLFLTNFKGGHGGRTKLSDTIDEFAGIFAFFYWQAGHPDFQPKN
ncbi:S9 family peptidase [Hyunsoonleella sp. SJ7]|uniref:prolyl oligopeptidase n=1 Tax=Hyunsoonleella aquatilis TaxID=2762758 RepID=A0A923HDX2_9FLAO|nr:prolyl oligopeptidase family serine peptidase [Hyunsoonleella aquatilis]MBC3757650.1 S9 family peptidase [Hyunsoonleella aquatilis]